MGDSRVESLHEQSMASLKQQKDTVKKELKLFEIHFNKFYGR